MAMGSKFINKSLMHIEIVILYTSLSVKALWSSKFYTH